MLKKQQTERLLLILALPLLAEAGLFLLGVLHHFASVVEGCGGGVGAGGHAGDFAYALARGERVHVGLGLLALAVLGDVEVHVGHAGDLRQMCDAEHLLVARDEGDALGDHLLRAAADASRTGAGASLFLPGSGMPGAS